MTVLDAYEHVMYLPQFLPPGFVLAFLGILRRLCILSESTLTPATMCAGIMLEYCHYSSTRGRSAPRLTVICSKRELEKKKASPSSQTPPRALTVPRPHPRSPADTQTPQGSAHSG